MNDAETNSVVKSTLIKHGILLLAGYAIGWLNGAALPGLLGASLIALGWHTYNIVKLRQWLNEKHASRIPYGTGMWSTIFARIHHFRERSITYKQQSQLLADAHSAFVHSLPNAAFELNERFEVLGANKHALRLIQSSRDQLSGHISNHLRQPAFVRHIESGDYSNGVILQDAHNPEITLQCIISKLSGNHWLLQAVDISVQIRALQIREDFVANASHELRTPVTVLKGYLEALVDDDNIETTMRAPILSMAEQVRRMEAIIGDLLTLNVIESSGPARKDHAINIAELLRSVHKDAQNSKRSIKSLELHIDSTASLLGEEMEIRSVFTNLVSNALRFTPDEGRVVISWRDHAEGVEFEVADNGIGIHEEDLPRITERFYRTAPGRKRHQFGTGLGLAIVKHALVRHDAELVIESTPGEGSRFSCLFPKERLERQADNPVTGRN